MYILFQVELALIIFGLVLSFYTIFIYFFYFSVVPIYSFVLCSFVLRCCVFGWSRGVEWVNNWVSVENQKHSTQNVTRKILFVVVVVRSAFPLFSTENTIFSHILFYRSESVSTMASDGHPKSALHERTRARVLVRSSSSPSMCLCATHSRSDGQKRYETNVYRKVTIW